MAQEQEAKPKTWGRFKLVSRVGTGGMGDVYKAFDPNLNRYIAPDKKTRLADEKEASAFLVKGIEINRNLKYLFDPYLRNF
ncbi:MAG: hypothetical protein GTO45_07515 [Candidatus Aminicenantes bacterium]|nr:hypothetical protein [Candidatus Aminicenantes bacterium]NIM78684.1 hypothetical protein [Candidatus Aminicenantes bacterium]NIN17931.1 hypothetical protein [Candidatus Aminicenantes bacterium]NIN41834.1 hypothetical protein [Candidatus Aminicenantes bacterium]NIN84586.1 hypothetical protein [Candidatus Aminicenantes bacterium]